MKGSGFNGTSTALAEMARAYLRHREGRGNEVTTASAQSRRARQKLLEEIATAYRTSHDPAGEQACWPDAKRALHAASEEAQTLARVGGQREREAWSSLAKRLGGEDARITAPLLAWLGYPNAVRQTLEMWECACGTTHSSGETLATHIEEWRPRAWPAGVEHGAATPNQTLAAAARKKGRSR